MASPLGDLRLLPTDERYGLGFDTPTGSYGKTVISPILGDRINLDFPLSTGTSYGQEIQLPTSERMDPTSLLINLLLATIHRPVDPQVTFPSGSSLINDFIDAARRGDRGTLNVPTALARLREEQMKESDAFLRNEYLGIPDTAPTSMWQGTPVIKAQDQLRHAQQTTVKAPMMKAGAKGKAHAQVLKAIHKSAGKRSKN